MISSDESDDDSLEFDEEQQQVVERNFAAEAQLITHDLLPQKSMRLYEKVFNNFIIWQNENNTNSFEESVLLVYFNELAKKFKPSTVWAKWSMLRTTLELRKGVFINQYHQLKTFMKNFAKNYKPKKAKTLTWKNIEQFLEIAEDSIYLCMKVILIFGVCGALRCSELVGINTNNVEDVGNKFIIEIKDNKNDYPREFVIGPPFYEKVKQYISLRPDDIETKRFFILYNKGKCIRQPIGKNKIAEVPKNVALFLNLENAESYTGHCFRRTGATLLSNSGANLIQIKNLGGWRSDAVAQGYVEKSLAVKQKNFEGIISARETVLANNNVSISSNNMVMVTTSSLMESTSSLMATTSNSMVTSAATNHQMSIVSSTMTAPISSIQYRDPLTSTTSNDIEKINNYLMDNSVEFESKKDFNNCKNNNNSCKKRKLSKGLLSNDENDEYSQIGMMKLYSCENCTITVNNYSCSHKHDCTSYKM